MKKSKKILIGLGCVALAAAVGAGAYFVTVRQQSKNYNLITVDTSSVPSPVESTGEYDVKLEDITMHYETYGKDDAYPLIVVHGNGGSKKNLSELASYLGNHYKVYVIESRCHGQSTDPGVISYDLMAKDIKQFCDELGLEKPYLVGHSDGGINALTVAYTYPELLGGFVSCGANSVPETFKPYFTIAVKINDIGKNDKLNELMLTLPQMNAELLGKITCPAYIVAGEYDIMWLSDTVFIHESIKDSKVAIIKGANHGSYISGDGKQAYVLCHEFFEGIQQ